MSIESVAEILDRKDRNSNAYDIMVEKMKDAGYNTRTTGMIRSKVKALRQVVPARTAPTLLPIIQQWCLPGTHIMSDGWAVWNNVAQLNGGCTFMMLSSINTSLST